MSEAHWGDDQGYDWGDDDRLLADVGRALRVVPPVPAHVVEAAKAVYTWRTIDAELAALAYDSLLDDTVGVSARSEAATLRMLTFEATSLSVELGVTADALVGQLVPPQSGTVTVRTVAGVVTTVPVDELGCFTVRPTPSGSFSLSITGGAGVRITTDWVTL